jgi:hypothetical protein
MATNLTGTTIAATYDQLLHVDDGPTSTEKIVYSGTGVATALKVGTQSVSVENIKLDGNTISTTNTNGNLVLSPNGTGSVNATKVAITGASTAGDARTNLGLGTMAIQNSSDVAITGGTLSGVVFTGSFSGLTLVQSATLATSAAAAGVNLNGNTLGADGTDTNIGINITPKGTGEVAISGKFGYDTGTGGTVTQLTDKTTGVTLNKLTGQITMNAATLNRNIGVSFTLTNSFIAATDAVIVNIKSGATANSYTATIDAVAAGSCSIHLHNHTTGTDFSEAVVLTFVVIKGAIA